MAVSGDWCLLCATGCVTEETESLLLIMTGGTACGEKSSTVYYDAATELNDYSTSPSIDKC